MYQGSTWYRVPGTSSSATVVPGTTYSSTVVYVLLLLEVEYER